MGNETSTPTNSDATIPSTPISAQKRRIVKAVKPPPIDIAATTTTVTEDHKQDDETTRNNSDAETRDKAAVRIQPKTKAKREQKLQQHRLTPKSGATTTTTTDATATTTSNTTTSSETPLPHPMSRFLSAFSVEPKHPEHKRKQWQGATATTTTSTTMEEDPDTPKQPSEKRLRAEESWEEDVAASKSRGSNDSVASNPQRPWITTTVGTIAVVLGLAAVVVWRYKKR